MAKIQLEKPIDLQKVLEFATEKHKGQKRDGGKDYIVHPIRVAEIVDKYKAKDSKNREVLLAAALLHDTLEDTYTSYRELAENFGDAVASLVQELTTAKYASKTIGKGLYLAEKMQYMTNYALTIKLADRLDNVNDLLGCSFEKQARIVKETYFILDYLIKRRALTTSQQMLTTEIKKSLEKFHKYDYVPTKNNNW